MTEIATVGVDLAKSVFQIHGIDAEGTVVVRRQLRRNQMPGFFRRPGPCLAGMEAWPGRFTGRAGLPGPALSSCV